MQMHNIMLIAYAGLLLLGMYRVEAREPNGFANSTSGYLYNIGTASYVKKAAAGTSNSGTIWLRTTKTPEEAIRLKIERSFHNGVTYNLIMVEDIEDIEMNVNYRKPGAYTIPFYGIPVASMIQMTNANFIGVTPDTSISSAWVTFSPPIYKRSNAFRIYFGDECATAAESGYIKTQKCVVGPRDEREKQLFMWLPENKYVAKNGVPVHIQSIKGYKGGANGSGAHNTQNNKRVIDASTHSGTDGSIYRRIGRPEKKIMSSNKRHSSSRMRAGQGIGGESGAGAGGKFGDSMSYQILPPGF